MEGCGTEGVKYGLPRAWRGVAESRTECTCCMAGDLEVKTRELET